MYKERRSVKWFVGLGNPGTEYASTRHNIGFMAIDAFAQKHGIKVTTSKVKGLIGEGRIGNEKVYLLKPMTYMNLSGESVKAFMKYFDAKLEDMVVLYDDLDTPYGQVRLRYQGSAGGHNGIKSMIQHTGTQTFNRIRMGISRPEPGFPISNYVLANFTREEMKNMEPILSKTIEAMEYSLDNSFERTMAKFNG